MDSNDVRFPWEEPENSAGSATPGQPAHEATSPPLAGAAHADAKINPDTSDPADDPWSGDRPADSASAEEDADPWTASGGTDAAPTAAGEAEQRVAPPVAASESGSSARERPIAQKEYYSISEVCDLVDLKPHVLRYWETQFAVLNPSKNRSGNRVYQRKEIKLIQLVKHLLYDEKYTVEGAKQKLEHMRRGGELPAATGRALDGQTIEMLRIELRRLSELLTPPEPA